MTCTHCGATSLAKAKFCHVCGQGYAVSGRLCVKCGATNTVDARFCVHCGGDLNALAARKVADNRPRTARERKRDKVIAFGSWFMALFLALQGTRNLPSNTGITLFVVAVAFAIGGFNIWPKTSNVPPGSGDAA